MAAAAVSSYRQQRLSAIRQQSSVQTVVVPSAAAQFTPRVPADAEHPIINFRQLRIAALHNAPPPQSKTTEPTEKDEPKVDLKSYRLARIKHIEESSIIGRLFKPGFLKKFPISDLQRHARYDCKQLLERGNDFRRILHPNEQEFLEVQQKFRQTCQQQIIQIEKNENPYLWLQYLLKKAEKQISLRSQELQLFHGTSDINIDAIFKENFNWRMAGRSTGTAYGNGVYFATAASTSKGYCRSQRKTMILARVLFVRYSAGRSGTLIPEPGCDATGSNGVYVKYGDFEYFPEYVITFV